MSQLMALHLPTTEGLKMGYGLYETEHDVRFLGFHARWTGGGTLAWLFWAVVVVLAGAASSAGIALVVVWAVNDIINHGVTWLPVFALVIALQLGTSDRG